MLLSMTANCLIYGSQPEQPEAEQAAISTFRVAPCYFVSNTETLKNGAKLVENIDVSAFVQTSNGRVMFTPEGAFFAVPVSPSRPGRAGKNTPLHESSDLSLRERMVVFKAGFSNTLAHKRSIVPHLEGKTGCTMNFLIGPEKNWRSGIPTYEKLVYDQVWDGITLEYLGFMDRLEFHLVLEPHSHATDIVMETGGEDIELLPDGSLVSRRAGAEQILTAPRAWQENTGERVGIPVRYRMLSGGRFGFILGSYDHSRPLVIDPQLTWSTYLGGSGGQFSKDKCNAIAVDSSNQIYVTGETESQDFPVTVGAYLVDDLEDSDVFVSKFNSSGSALLYSTLIGGSDFEKGTGIKVDSVGHAYITGNTQSSNYPTTSNVFDSSYNGGSDCFLTVLNTGGSALIYSTFLGGNGSDEANAIDIDSSGKAFVTGATHSNDFPVTTGVFDNSYNGLNDCFVSVMSADGTSLTYSTFIGDSASDCSLSIRVDASGRAFIAGYTGSSDFPTTSGAFCETLHGSSYDGFVALLNAQGSSLVYASFLGGASQDRCYAVDVDSSGQAYVTGYTYSNDFPTTSGVIDDSSNGGNDPFITVFNSTGSDLVYSSYLGGSCDDTGYGIVVDASGKAYISGTTCSSNLSTTAGAFQTVYGGSRDAFVVAVNSSGTAIVYQSYLGGTRMDEARAITLDSHNRACIAGFTLSTDYPTTGGSYDPTYNGGNYDGFITVMSADGQALGYSSFIGGSGQDLAYGLALDSSGRAYVTGYTQSASFPTTTGVYQSLFNGGESDVFVTRLSSDAQSLSYSTFLGGMEQDSASDIAVDSSGQAYVTGFTYSSDYPTTNLSYDESHNGGKDVFVSKLSADGTSLIYSTFLGGWNNEEGKGITVDSTGNAYVVGHTYSTDFPTTVGAFSDSYDANIDTFVTILESDGSKLFSSTYLGGDSYDYGKDIALDGAGRIIVTGQTYSTDFPTTTGAFSTVHNGGGYDGFISAFNSTLSSLAWSSFIGGTNSDACRAIAVNSSGQAMVTGTTRSSDFPTTTGAYDESHNGSDDVFVATFTSAGDGLVYATFLGASSSDEGMAIAVDSSGKAYVTGYTYSASYPTTSGVFDSTINGDTDVFVSVLNTAGSELSYSTFLGGAQEDYGTGIESDSSGNIYVTGYTRSTNYPVSAGAYTERGNAGSAFVTKLDPNCTIPDQPGPVSGDSVVCEGATGKLYSIAAVNGATSYHWTIPPDAHFTSGQGSLVISVDFGSQSGEVYVKAVNDCGYSEKSSKAITIITEPPQPGPISGNTQVCFNETGVHYSISYISGATGYTWTVPPGATIASGQGGLSIYVNFGTESGNITVTPENSCGSGIPRSLTVQNVSPVSVLSSPEDTELCPGSRLTATVENAGGGTFSWQWYKGGTALTDGGTISGTQTQTLVIFPVALSDDGSYFCTVSNSCSSVQSTAFDLDVTASGPFGVVVSPPSAAQGLDPLTFTAFPNCGVGTISWQWTNLQNGLQYTANPLVLPVLTQSASIRLIATDEDDQSVTVTFPVLCHRSNTLDLNGDGHNSMSDLWFLGLRWRTTYANDPNGDGYIDIRDFLYINTSGSP
jgi:hypothetical protein